MRYLLHITSVAQELLSTQGALKGILRPRRRSSPHVRRYPPIAKHYLLTTIWKLIYFANITFSMRVMRKKGLVDVDHRGPPDLAAIILCLLLYLAAWKKKDKGGVYKPCVHHVVEGPTLGYGTEARPPPVVRPSLVATCSIGTA